MLLIPNTELNKLKPDKSILWDRHKKEIDQLISNTYWKNKMAMDYLGVNQEEYVGIANVIICENLNDFNENKGSLFGFLTSLIKRKMFTYIRDQNREKRKANIHTKSIQGIVENKNGDFYKNKSLIDDRINDINNINDIATKDIPAIRYLSKLSEMQKNVLILRLCEYPDAAIIKSMKISRKQFNDLLSGMRMIEKTQYIKEEIS